MNQIEPNQNLDFSFDFDKKLNRFEPNTAVSKRTETTITLSDLK